MSVPSLVEELHPLSSTISLASLSFTPWETAFEETSYFQPWTSCPISPTPEPGRISPTRSRDFTAEFERMIESSKYDALFSSPAQDPSDTGSRSSLIVHPATPVEGPANSSLAREESEDNNDLLMPTSFALQTSSPSRASAPSPADVGRARQTTATYPRQQKAPRLRRKSALEPMVGTSNAPPTRPLANPSLTPWLRYDEECPNYHYHVMAPLDIGAAALDSDAPILAPFPVPSSTRERRWMIESQNSDHDIRMPAVTFGPPTPNTTISTNNLFSRSFYRRHGILKPKVDITLDDDNLSTTVTGGSVSISRTKICDWEVWSKISTRFKKTKENMKDKMGHCALVQWGREKRDRRRLTEDMRLLDKMDLGGSLAPE
ncbi:uncharacterized protein RCO7_03929 [Rhynchosporium graminicola]|uniref:Uncharacterized protein n=1 Tax=Rhynchosporium graminicola TaxID=2792576 RepID=A0A1E1L5T8_9HELO|nr:uncharacterized protein RCO7_03929 [Rhynchosporium commune]